MHWSTKIGRALVWVWCVLGGTGAVFGELPATPERPLRYVMVLKAAGRGASEPNVPEVGGRELSRWGTRRLIEIPRQAIDALSRRHDILYLALVDDGKDTDAPRYVRPEASGAARTVETNAEPELTWDSGVYQYDGSGNVTAIGGATYRYDQAQRLVKAVMGGETIEYTYDSFGNQVQRKIGTTVIPSTASARSNRLDYAEYDRAGNQTSAIGSGEEYVYDAANMMVQRKGIIPKRYIYTADDERIGTANGTEELEWEWTVRDFSGRVIATYEAVGKNELTTWEWQESHHYREGTLASGLKVEEHVRDPKGGRHFHVDDLGTPRLITNQARQQISAHDFHPFGREQTRLNQEFTDWGYRTLEPMKFTGHERDYTTSFDSNVHDYLDYMHARYYSPGWGRFLSVDPGRDWDPAKPQSWNMYAYVRSNPINSADPTGRCTVTSGFFMPCARATQKVSESLWSVLFDAAENSAMGEVFLAAESGDTRRQQIAQLRMTHETMTGIFVTGMASSELNAPSSAGFMDDARFAQRTYSNAFGAGGELAGRTVDDVASALKTGAMNVKDLRVDYVVRDGNTLILNTRSAKALEHAGIPRSQWNVVNRTGQRAYETRLTEQLRRNRLSSDGVENVRRSGQ